MMTRFRTRMSPRLLGLHCSVYVAALICTLLASTGAAQTTWYVDAANCPGPGDGSQGNPFCQIQTAITAAVNGDTIRVADGVYSGTANKNLDFGGRLITLRSSSGDPAACIIDCEGNGRGFYFHTNETAAALVEGFTIRNGGSGGIYCYYASPTITNCTITGNSAFSGGGLCCYSYASPTLSSCSFDGNTAAGFTDSSGGGIYCYDHSSPTLTSCTIAGNAATATDYCYGGGLCCQSYSSPTLSDCTIAGNTAIGELVSGGGGGVSCLFHSAPVLNNSVILNNSTSHYGGGVYCSASMPTLTGCEITDNTAPLYGGGIFCNSASPILSNCTVSFNSHSGLHCQNSSPTLTHCNITGNNAFAGGGMWLTSSSNPALIGCTISSNTASSRGGGMYCEYSSSPQVTNCTISGNTAFGSGAAGGGVYFFSSANPTLRNCTITGNATSSYGGGLYCSSASPVLTNCTIGGNSAIGFGGALFCTGPSSSPALTNSILWGDTPQQIYVASGTPVVTYCDVQGGYAGMGNISLDPAFAFSDDFHLTSASPCIDAGTNSPPGGLPAEDADGNTRPQDGDGDGQSVADMGAYEFNPTTPAIALSPTQVVLHIAEGGLGQKTLSIRNAGGGTLNWAVTPDTPWLQANPLQGDSAGEVDSVILMVDATALLHGVYSTALSVSDSLALPASRTVEIVLNVTTVLHVPGEYATIQAAIDAASVPGDQVLIADGTYTGTGNKDLDFGGKAIRLRSESGNAANCIIDCQGSGRGFYFHTRETADAEVNSLTIRNGSVTSSSPGSYYGGGVCCDTSSPTLTSLIITASTAYYGGGVFCSYSDATLADCTINANSASYSGGGASFSYCSAVLTDCTINGNASSGSSAYGIGVALGSSRTKFFNCTISGNIASGYSAVGGGIYCSSYSPVLLTNCMIDGNILTGSSASGGGVYCSTSPNLTVTNCAITRNRAFSGGGVTCLSSSSPRMTNCTLSGNTAFGSSAYGGALYCSFSNPKLSNCLITGNLASGSASPRGAGVYCSASSPTLTNCTFSGNAASSAGGGMYCTSTSSSPILTNCILWGDAPEEIYVSSGAPVVSYGDIQWGYTGNGNIDLDPLFLDPDGPDGDPATWEDNDYRLAASSPCIDAGNNAAVPVDAFDLDGDGDTSEPIPFDLDGFLRFVDEPASPDCPYVPDTCGTAPIVDMGAYERQLPFVLGDLDCNGAVDLGDIGAFVLALVDPVAYQAAYPACDITRADLDASGTVDGLDIPVFVSELLP